MTSSDELRELRAAVRSFLEAYPGSADQTTWRRFAGELGVAGLAVPEEYGGAGCGLREAAIVSEEIGRALSPLPYLSTAVLAVSAINESGDGEAKKRLLPGIADGTVTATVIFPGVFPGDAGLSLDGGRLSGVAPYALDGDVVLAYVGDALVEAAPSARRPYVTLDETRPLVELTFDGAEARRIGSAEACDRVRDLGVAALAAEQVGGAARCLESAVAYAKQRHQFGRPIGSFQAIKHKLADVLLQVESARSAAYQACAAPADELPVYAAIAGSYCTEAYLTAAGESIQVHGGIGVTWEHDAHRYFKRATSDAQLFGPPQAHRARLAQVVL
ncbi:acyl-CoA dehydrogenase family protein [Microtetraspora sp. NBRC 16547]|uniref:acyl-CoA dehydrogenase family protein n=1 Tax=Microtetraspora sp. NBRC 16547 TaxID=3030993 RepID=UPI002552DFC2|nr:acyl-CoA dehydrogenase family protein [Microtetraspora sp. NBRC 16547]